MPVCAKLVHYICSKQGENTSELIKFQFHQENGNHWCVADIQEILLCKLCASDQILRMWACLFVTSLPVFMTISYHWKRTCLCISGKSRVQEKGEIYSYTPGSYSVLSQPAIQSLCIYHYMWPEFARTTSTIYLQKRSKTLSARARKVAAAA